MLLQSPSGAWLGDLGYHQKKIGAHEQVRCGHTPDNPEDHLLPQVIHSPQRKGNPLLHEMTVYMGHSR